MKCRMCGEEKSEEEFYLYQNFVLYEYHNCQKCRGKLKRDDALGGFDEYSYEGNT